MTNTHMTERHDVITVVQFCATDGGQGFTRCDGSILTGWSVGCAWD